jgi:hypothetical protein
MAPARCAACGKPTDGAYRCPACTAAAETSPTPTPLSLEATTEVGQIKSPFHWSFSPGAGIITRVVWAKPRQRPLRWTLNIFRFASVAYLLGVVAFVTEQAMFGHP